MSEAAAATEEPISEDDWAAAMAEQTTADEALAELDSSQAQPDAQPANIFQQFGESANKSDEGLRDFEMILDIPVQLTVELGRTRISIRNLLQLGHGSVVELDGMAGEPMDVLVNGTLIAQGEVVVVNDKFGIRLTDIITPSERMKKLKR
ncbi:flagellar motor switch protein FliN [Methyloversatilis thermotolerans]|uniref:flagellar motor switch protein FliN n=1 Tax=Methyloversatilis thermotolerans TaxID=1346290 RepID=UPI000382CD3B|nr:flagellar motor switch protein FliN [Methyloversatilis thermotolerans]